MPLDQVDTEEVRLLRQDIGELHEKILTLSNQVSALKEEIRQRTNATLDALNQKDEMRRDLDAALEDARRGRAIYAVTTSLFGEQRKPN